MASPSREVLPHLNQQKSGQVSSRSMNANFRTSDGGSTQRDYQDYAQKVRQMQLDCLPQEVMLVLNSTGSTAAEPPTTTSRGNVSSRRARPGTSLPPKPRTDNLWYFSKQRDRWKHLLQSPVCMCGAGKDISFLYEQERPKPKKDIESTWPADPSTARLELIKKQKKEVELPDSLIAEEYQLVKSRGVLGLEYHGE